LRNKKYYIFNEESTKEEFEKLLKDKNKLKQKFEDFKLKQIHNYATILNSENCS
jgi:hypothetical protein